MPGRRLLIGGDGDDALDGNQANDVAFMGVGDDTFRWDPGDGSDVIEGEDGSDTLSSTAPTPARPSTFRPTASGSSSSATPGNITMDTNEVEPSLQRPGRSDTITSTTSRGPT